MTPSLHSTAAVTSFHVERQRSHRVLSSLLAGTGEQLWPVLVNAADSGEWQCGSSAVQWGPGLTAQRTTLSSGHGGLGSTTADEGGVASHTWPLASNAEAATKRRMAGEDDGGVATGRHCTR